MKRRLLAAALAVALLGLPGCRAEGKPQPTAPLPTETAGSTQDRALLLSVLDGETEIAVEADFYNDLSNGPNCGLESGTRLTLSGLTEHLEEMSLYPEQGRLDVSYALLETLGGREMLALRFLSGNEGADSNNFYLVLGAFDGQVRLVYARDFWYRSYADLSAELIFNGEGSSGAGDHFSWCGYIDDAGRYRLLYELETLVSSYVAMHAYEVFGMDSDWARECECYLLDTDSGKFYQLVAGENVDPEKLALLREYLEDDQGRAEIEDASAAIDAVMDAYGLTDAEPFEDWAPLAARTPEAQAAFDTLLAGDVSVLADPDRGQDWLIAWDGDWGLEYTYLDLDGDGQAELLAQLEDDPCGFNAVYHYEDGKLQVWQSDAIEMTCRDYPLADGTMVRQYDLLNASYTIFRYDAQGGETQLNILSGRESDPEGNPDPHYTVDGEQVDARTFADTLNERVTQKLLPRSAWRPVKEK